jgi:hypothetical protein
MALNTYLVAGLADLNRRGILENFTEVVEIGAQQLAQNFLRDTGSLDYLYGALHKTRPFLGDAIDAGLIDGIERLPDEAPSSKQFWQSIGLNYTAVEFDGHRDSIALDLNRDKVPRRMRGKFDLVVNWGTTEHVANQDNAFRVIHDLCTENGIMMHFVPAGGMMNHGLINYNTKFFWHLCRENGYEALMLKTIATGINPVPQNIIDSNEKLGATVGYCADNVAKGDVADFYVIATLRKANDQPFVTPLDIPADLIRRKTGGPHAFIRRVFG